MKQKKLVFRLIVLIAVIFLSSTTAQAITQEQKDKIIEDFKTTNGQEWFGFEISDLGQVNRGLREKDAGNLNTTEEQAERIASDFLAKNKDFFKIDDMSNIEFEKIEYSSNAWAVNYIQKNNGVKVYNGGIRVIVSSTGRVYSFQNFFTPNIDAPKTPAINETDAVKVAQSRLGTAISPESVVLRIVSNQLAWVVTFGYPIGMEVFVNAENGIYMDSVSTTKEALGASENNTENKIPSNVTYSLAIILILGILFFAVWRIRKQ